MTKVFIDANVYLTFYDQYISKFQKLLESIKEIDSNLFVTQQIAEEVRRNQLRVAKDSLVIKDSQLKLGRIKIPAQFESSDSDELNSLNKEIEDAIKKLQDFKQRYDAKSSSILSEISKSADRVSIELDTLFKSALQPTREETEAAIQRHRFGKPPGKYNNSVGDQLSWEQLLNAYDGNETLVIITRDGDYYTEYGKASLFLNAFLYQELKEISEPNDPDVYVFNKLSDGIAFYKNLPNTDDTKFPNDEVLDDIREEEEKSADDRFSEDTKLPDPVKAMSIIKAMNQANRAKEPNESTLYHLLKNEDVDSYPQALALGLKKIMRLASEIENKDE